MSETPTCVETHVQIDATGRNAVDVLRESTGLPKQRIKNAMQLGAVWLTRGRNTKRLRRAKRQLQVGDELHLYYNPSVLEEIPPEPALVADLGDYSVWNKPYGLRSQGSKWGDHCTLARWAAQHLVPERPAFIVHRLDRAANGLMLLAHTRRMAANLSGLFRDRAIEKDYRAQVVGDFSAEPNPMRVNSPIDGKSAVSEFRVRQVVDDGARSIVDVRIESGRKHQIRRHLAECGYPVVGDRLYGAGATPGIDADVDLQLTAYRLAFHCPVGDMPVEYRLADDAVPDQT